MSFLPDAIASQNTFIGKFTNTPSYDVFKTHLLAFFRPKKRSIFNIHDPWGIRFLFQLRLGLSPLRSHKKRHNFVDTPSDLCLCNTDIEDTKHFLFKCPFYAIKRASLATEVIPILTRNNLNHLSDDEKLYLYGSVSINDNDNKAILLATIKFLKDTNRFSIQTSSPSHSPFLPDLLLLPTVLFKIFHFILFSFFNVCVLSCNYFYFIIMYCFFLFCLSLKIKPSCQTLPKAFDLSKNTVHSHLHSYFPSLFW